MKRRLIFPWIFFLAGALYGQKVTILEHVNIIDGTGKSMMANQNMIIKDGVISGINTDKNITKDATIINLAGKYIMPEIINAHGHLGILKDTVTSAANFTSENIRRQLLRYQQYGVAAVVSMGSDQELIIGLRDSSRSGKIPGATIYSALYGFSVKDSGPPKSMGMVRLYRPETVQQAISEVDSLALLKPDLIKIWVDDFGGQSPKMKPGIYGAIIKEAHSKGIRVASHLYYLEDARRLVDAGLDIIAHSVRDAEIDDTLIAAMKKNKVMYIPTLSLDEFAYAFEGSPGWINDPFFKAALEPGVFEMITRESYKDRVRKDPKTPKEKAALQIAMKNVVKLYRAGVLVALGTDSGAMPIRVQGFSEHMEMELYVAAGLTPMEAIKIATQNGTRLLHIDNERGSLQVGKKADFIVLDANPLDNIRNTHAINSVWKNGEKVADKVF
ncbi:MAG: amidohydrolase family protein [Ginsengibacter sp.]